MGKRMKKAKGVAASAGTAAAEASIPSAALQPPVDSGFKSVPIEEIEADGTEREGGSDVAALAESIARNGLLQPLVVNPEGKGRYWLLAGRRRLEAVKSLGWKTVPCHILTCDATERVEALAAVENLERRDLTPVEEGLAVARLLETLGAKREDLERGAAPAAAVLRAAALLGRSAAWVRDRGMLLRLCPEVRALVASKRLPLGQAKEIAKLVSAEDQKEVAGITLGGYGDIPEAVAGEAVQIAAVRSVRRWVAERFSTLRGVPWRDDVDFAGRPACDKCPDNSANCLLFGSKNDEAPEARCLNAPCHATKMRAAEKALAEAVKKNAKDKTVAATAAGVRSVTPEYLKPATVARDLARARGLAPKKSRAQGPKQDYVPYEDRPESKLRQAHADWQNRIYDLVASAIAGRPFGPGCAVLVHATKGWGRHVGYSDTPSKGVRHQIEPLLKRVASGKEADLAALARDVGKKQLLDNNYGFPSWCIRRLAGLLDVNLPPEPKLEDFEPKAEPASAGKPQKGVCRKCGCTEDAACPGGCAWADKTRTICTRCAEKTPKAKAKK